MFADENVRTVCKGKQFGDTCDAYCYEGYQPTTAVTYECVDVPHSTWGKWQAPSTGGLTCTGIPCASGPPEDRAGSAVGHATACARVPHYDRTQVKTCDHGNAPDAPCKAGYNFNSRLENTKQWDECARPCLDNSIRRERLAMQGFWILKCVWCRYMRCHGKVDAAETERHGAGVQQEALQGLSKWKSTQRLRQSQRRTTAH